ncbi:MAG: protein rep [Bacteroidetes bacterium]|nr:protein rep [Bacteroidota bacterium]
MKKNNQSKSSKATDHVSVPKEQSSFGRIILDTSGQLGTGKNKKPLLGLGLDLSDKQAQNARAKRKLVTRTVVLALIDIAKEKEDKEMEKSLWNTYHCLDKVSVSGDKLYGEYCRNRVCTVCSGIRRAKIIDKYLPIIKSWDAPHMVTLTTKSCYAMSLEMRMRAMKRAFKKIMTKCKKRYQRGKGPKLIGLKSLECNFNPTTRTYNPHYHVIVPNWEVAILLKREWMKLWTKRYTNGWGQDIRKINNNEEGLIEVVKYGSKIFTEPDPNQKNKKKVTRYVYISALYNILNSMRGIRLFDRFGFNLPKEANKNSLQTSTILEYEELSYHSDIMDWVNEKTGETLSGFTPDQELMNLLNHRIDINLQ